MPELPEVERVRRTLEARVLGRRIVEAKVLRRDVVAGAGDPAGGFARQRRSGASAQRPARIGRADLLEGARIARVLRHGKQLALVGDTGRVVCIHLGMTGQLLVSAGGAGAGAPHVHIVWRLDDGSSLVFRDARRFGGVWLCRDRADLEARRWSRLGPDALTVSGEEMRMALRGGARPVKGALLDQEKLAGVGNIYADEALFRAGIRPTRRAARITRAEAERLAAEVRAVLRDALDAGGSTLRDYVDANGDPGGYQRLHAVYGRAGEACVGCGGRLRSGPVAQRTTVWCGACQR